MTRISPANTEFVDYVTLVDIRKAMRGPPRPPPIRERILAWGRRHLLLLVMVVVPTALAATYYAAIAPDQYVSETRFVVRSPSRSAAGLLSGFLQSTGFVRAQDDSYVVEDYVESRAAMSEILASPDLREAFSRPAPGFLARLPLPWADSSSEALYRQYRQVVKVSTDSGGGVTTLEVKAFRPDDAQKLAQALLERAESLVNRLNDRARQDAIRFTKQEVTDSEVRLTDVQAALTSFRTKVAMVDPGKQSSAMFEMIDKLSDDVVQNKARLDALMRQAPQSPQIEAMRGGIEAMERQIGQERARIVGGNGSMAPLIADYEQLLLQRELGMKLLESAATSLENARLEAQRQQIYIERIVDPNRPDAALYPKRMTSILLAFALCFAGFVIVRFLLGHVRDHATT